MNRIAVVLTLLTPLALGARAAASPAGHPASEHRLTDAERAAAIVVSSAGPDGRRSATQYLPPTAFLSKDADQISPIIFLNRCVGGCTIYAASVNSAANQQSTIPQTADGTPVMIPAFPWDDATWNTMLQCVKEVYSPFNVQIVDVDPGPTVVHHEIIVAGDPSDLGLPKGVGGISPVNGDHTPKNNNISFAFAAVWPPSQVLVLCAAIGQETAHSWGLDHEFTCVDPMGAGYQNQCGGQMFFRNHDFKCGTAVAGDCNCDGLCVDAGPTQNSHEQILAVFGPGQSIVPGPTVSLIAPKDGDSVSKGFLVDVSSVGKRGTFKVKLLLNGYQWAEQDTDIGPPTNQNAPIYAGKYAVTAPDGVPDGVIDIEAQACDDLDQCGTVTATVTKGAPCADATTCAKGQKCDAGKCYWDPASGAVGDSCDFPQACLSGLCVAAGSTMFCTQKCFQGIAGQCPDSFTCAQDGSGQGYCLPAGDGGGGGCCSASDESAGATAARFGLGGLVLLVAFRRRRRASV